MGVVRREGDWRLEKRADGIYEVTYEKRTELKIVTSDYEPSGFVDERNDLSVPVREVESFSEAEQIFEETAGQTPGVGGFESSSGYGNTSGIESNGELSDLPPAGFFLVGAIAGGLFIQQAGITLDSPVFIIGAAFLLLPVGISVLTYQVYRTDGPGAAMRFLVASDGDKEAQHAGAESDDSPEKTPPAPERVKDEIYFDRADQRCEWCGDRTDSPEIHHIVPRAEGGSNDYENLIALCPGCHSKADKGGISRSKLESKVSRQLESWSNAPEQGR